MNFSVADFHEAVRDYQANWSGIDAELYELCKRYPAHSDSRERNAKLWLIGRTYATGIERKIRSKRTQGSSLNQLSDHLSSHAQDLDCLISQLKTVTEPLTPNKLQNIVQCHGQFLRILRGVTRKGQTVRSFASKYLHFHCPAVPIIDTYVSGVLPKIVRWSSDLWVFDPGRTSDEFYAWYVMRFWKLYQTARESIASSPATAAQSVCVKHLDYYLIWLSGTDAAAPSSA